MVNCKFCGEECWSEEEVLAKTCLNCMTQRKTKSEETPADALPPED